MNRPLRIVFASSEAAPFSASGGMGQVCGDLPRALARLGHRVMVVSPRYARLNGPQAPAALGQDFWFWLGGAHHQARYMGADDFGVEHVFVDNPMYQRPGLYGDGTSLYGDNLVRFALLSRAALEAPRRLDGWRDHPVDVLHAHDWQSALVTLYANALYRPLGLYADTRTVLTLHNAAHPGAFASDAFAALDLAPRHRAALDRGDHISTLRAGIVSADRVTAVSPTFAHDLCTPEGGFGFHDDLRRRRADGALSGILNGIDVHDRDPSSDPHLSAHFSLDDLSGKARAKAHLLDTLGLTPEPDDAPAPLIIMVTRMDWQKGVDFALPVLSEAVHTHNARVVVMGSGDPALEAATERAERAAPDRFRAWIGYDDALARRLYAAADLCLVPSRFEPCGLSQLYAMRYGAVPVVRATGGLMDTVEPWNPSAQTGWGWRFHDATEDALRTSVGWALSTYVDHPEAFAAVRRNAMAQDVGWERAARSYVWLYRDASP